MSATQRESHPESNQVAFGISANPIIARRFGSSVEKELEDTLWKLVAGEIELTDLTPGLQAWWTVAADFGRKSATHEQIDRLEWEVSYWHFRATNPGKDYYAAVTGELWAVAA